MLKKALFLGLIFVGYLGLTSMPASAQDYDYQPGKPLVVRKAGAHYTILNIQRLDKPLPSFDTQDLNELERYVVVQLRLDVGTNGDEETVNANDFRFKSGFNRISAMSRYDTGFKAVYALGKYALKWQMSQKTLVVKPGHHANFDLLYKVYPNNDEQFIIDLNRDVVQRINLSKVQSQNGITPSVVTTEGGQ